MRPHGPAPGTREGPPVIKGSLESITKASNEATIRGKISAWLDADGMAHTPEYEIGSWSADTQCTGAA